MRPLFRFVTTLQLIARSSVTSAADFRSVEDCSWRVRTGRHEMGRGRSGREGAWMLMVIVVAVGAGLGARAVGGDWSTLGWMLVVSAAAVIVYALIHAD